MPSSNLLQDAAGNFLQLAKASEVILKIVVEDLRVLRPQLGAQDHIAQFDGMWKQRVLLELVERGFCIIVIHRIPQWKNAGTRIVLAQENASERCGVRDQQGKLCG
jgi:hypothetical protein